MAFESRLSLVIDTRSGEQRLRALESQLDRTQASGDKLISGMGALKVAFGAVAGIGVAASFRNTIATITDFQNEMSGLQAVVGASVEDLARLEQQARLLGATTAYGANQAAQAQKFLAQGGLEVNQILGATPRILQLAQAGMLGLGESADLATDVMAAMSLQIEDISRIGDVLVATSQAATTDVQGLGQALAYSASQSSDFNLTLEETVAALGMISSTGAKGTRAGTGLVGVIAQLSNVSGPAKEILDKYGISLEDVNVATRGLIPVLQTLADAGLAPQERMALFNREASGAAGALINGLPAYKAQVESLQDVDNAAGEAAKTMTDNLGGAFKGLGSAIAEANLQLGDSGLTKTLDAIVKTGTGVVQILNGMGDEWAASTEGGERFLSTAQSLVDTLEVMAVLAGARLTTALLAATGAQYQKLAATQASAVAEAAAASAVTRRTAAEALAEKRLLGRAIAEAKATQGTAAHTAALAALNVQRARSIQASTANTVAVNAEAAAMGRASVAARGLAVAGRAGAGALALIGGPLGAAVIATGAIFHFREELGLVARPAITAAGAVDELALRVDGAADSMLKFEVAAFTAELVSLQTAAQQAEENLARLEETKSQPSSFGQGQQGDLWAGADRQRAQLESLNNQINAREEAIGKLTDRINQLKESEDDASDSTRNLNINIAGLDEEAAKAAKTLADNFESLKRQLDPSYSSLMDFWEGIELLNEAIDTTTIEGMTEYNRLVGLLTDRYAEATKGSDDAKKALERLTQQYDSQYQRGVALTQAIDDINAAYRRGDIDGQQYGRMIQGVRDEMAELALEADPMAQEMARAWEEATNRIDETFSGAFAGAFDSFDSFADQLLDGFKRLLAELAYQATLKPIVVGFTQDMRGLMSGGAGGFGNTIGAARGLMSSGSALMGGGTAAAAPSLAMQGGLSSAALASASQVAGGATYGGWAGSAASGAALGNVASGSIMSSITAGVSAAMPWIAGGLAIDSLLGGGITKAIGGLFGGRKTNPHLNIDTRANDSYGHGSVRQGAFGAVGFAQGTRRSNDLFGGIPEEREFLAAIAASDDLLASLARSPQELQAMAEAVQGVRLSASSVEGVMAQLSNRTVAAVSAIDGEFGEFVGGLGTDVDTLIARSQSAMGALNLLGAASENLNLQFDVSASGALRAADSIAQLAGGVDQLAGLQENYYQAYFSDAERAADLQRELTKTLAQMGMTLPNTHDGFRQLVEQQNRLTESGQRNYVQLLQLAGPFDQLQQMLQQTGTGVDTFADRLSELNSQMGALENDVLRAYQAFERQAFDQQITLLKALGDEQAVLNLQRERELQSIDPLLHETQRFIWAMEDEAQAKANVTQAAQNYRREIERVREQLSSTLGNISQWVDQRTATTGTPGVNLAEAGDQFARQLVLAQAGDRNALQSITQYAEQYLAAGEAMYASGGAFQRIQGDVLDALRSLPDNLSAEEYLAQEIRDALQSVVISAMPTDQRLATQLSREMQRLDTNQLTAAQVRAALAPHATDAEINKLLRRVDANGDGIITQQELNNLRVAGLASGIGSTLKPMFDSLDANFDDLIDWNEFYGAFQGLASDSELRRIFNQLDKDGSGTISRLEALGRSSEGTEDNTKTLEDRAREQLQSLNGLVGEMTRTTDQFAGLNSTMLSLKDSINALGVAQAEVARIEQERVERQQQEQLRLITSRADSAWGMLNPLRDTVQEYTQTLAQNRDKNVIDEGRSGAYQLARGGLAQHYYEHDNVSNATSLEYLLSGSASALANPRNIPSIARVNQLLAEYNEAYQSLDPARGQIRNLENQIVTLRSEYKALTGKAAPFAMGGIFEGGRVAANSIVSSPTYFDMGLMGEADPEAIVPLSRGAGGRLGIDASGLMRLPDGPLELPMPDVPLPQFPKLGNADVVQVLNDLRNENKQLRNDINRLLGDVRDNTGKTADEVAATAQRAERQRAAQLAEQQAATRAARVKGRTV